jgi:hypothetical protein
MFKETSTKYNNFYFLQNTRTYFCCCFSTILKQTTTQIGKPIYFHRYYVRSALPIYPYHVAVIVVRYSTTTDQNNFCSCQFNPNLLLLLFHQYTELNDNSNRETHLFSLTFRFIQFTDLFLLRNGDRRTIQYYHRSKRS